MLQHAETILPMAGEIQAELNCHTAGVSDSHAWGSCYPPARVSAQLHIIRLSQSDTQICVGSWAANGN